MTIGTAAVKVYALNEEGDKLTLSELEVLDANTVLMATTFINLGNMSPRE